MNTETQNPTLEDSTPSRTEAVTPSCSNAKSRFSPTATGVLIGAVAGSILPVFGTISGAIIGGISGKIYEKKCQKNCHKNS